MPNFSVGGPRVPEPPAECCPEGCVGVGCGFAELHVPIELHPNVCVGRVETECCGEPSVVCEPECCGDGCRLVVTQRVRVRVPIRFDVCAVSGGGSLGCVCEHGGD